MRKSKPRKMIRDQEAMDLLKQTRQEKFQADSYTAGSENHPPTPAQTSQRLPRGRSHRKGTQH